MNFKLSRIIINDKNHKLVKNLDVMRKKLKDKNIDYMNLNYEEFKQKIKRVSMFNNNIKIDDLGSGK